MNNKNEPRFKVGDQVITKKHNQCTPPLYNASNMDKYVGAQGEITSITAYENGTKAYVVHNFYWPESALELANGAITENHALCGMEQQFKVGNQYEFSDGEDWVKGKAVGTVDYEGQRNFVVEINGKLSVFESIRPIHPVKIECWANVFPSGYISDHIYSTEAKAKKNGNSDCKQVKLEGTYTF